MSAKIQDGPRMNYYMNLKKNLIVYLEYSHHRRIFLWEKSVLLFEISQESKMAAK